MAGQGKDDSERFSDTAPSVGRQTRAPYDTLIRQSRKLGQKAMRAMSGASQGARQMLGQRPTPANASDIEELKQVITHSHEVIASAKTVPSFWFPDEVILDRTKITINKRMFIWSSDVISIRIEDVLNVSASVGPIFGSITIASRVMNSVDHFDVARFWRDDALMLKQIIQGYLIAKQNGVQTDHLSCSELAQTLYELESNT